MSFDGAPGNILIKVSVITSTMAALAFSASASCTSAINSSWMVRISPPRRPRRAQSTSGICANIRSAAAP